MVDCQKKLKSDIKEAIRQLDSNQKKENSKHVESTIQRNDNNSSKEIQESEVQTQTEPINSEAATKNAVDQNKKNKANPPSKNRLKRSSGPDYRLFNEKDVPTLQSDWCTRYTDDAEYYERLHRCYWILTNGYDIDEARGACAQNNGTVGLLYDSDTNEFIRNNVFSSSCPEVYIGVYDLQTSSSWEGIWKTDDGYGITWMNWQPYYQPNGTSYGGAIEKCVINNRNCYWEDKPCYGESYGVLCEAPAAIQYDNNTEFHDRTQKYYWFVSANLDKQHADIKCQEKNGSLATIKDTDTISFINSTWTDLSNPFWVKNNATWGNDNTTLCVFMRINNWQLDMRPCSDHLNFLCESQDSNDCASNPCQSKGTCVDGFNTYKCFCDSSRYTGDNCETTLCLNPVAAYDSVSDKCYWRTDKTGNQTEGAADCKIFGGTHYDPLDIESGMFIRSHSIYPIPSYGKFWIGVTDVYEEGIWLLSNSTEISYNKWVSSRPLHKNHGGMNKNIYDCVYITHSLSWYDYPCYNELYSLCQADPSLIHPQSEMDLNELQYYWYATGNYTAEDANRQCQIYEGQLAAIINNATEAFIKNHIFPKGMEFPVWTGLKSETAGVWRTWDQKIIVNDTNWDAPSNPDITGVLPVCAVLTSNWTIDDVNCTEEYPALCVNTDGDDCKSNTCLNGGSCIDIFNDFYCYCYRVWTGRYCEIPLCSHLNATLIKDTQTCYWKNKEMTNQTEGMKSCHQFGGKLAEDFPTTSLTLIKEDTFYVNDVQLLEYFWISMNDQLDNNNVWTTMTGETTAPVRWRNFYRTFEPHGIDEKHCSVVCSTDLSWEDASCTSDFRSLCQADAKTGQMNAVSGKYFWYNETMLTAEEANTVCRQYEGQLATIADNETFTSYIQYIFPNNETSDFWTGINDRDVEAVFVSWDGQNVNWLEWDPAFTVGDTNDTDCTILTNTSQLRNVNCSELHTFVCEFVGTDECFEGRCVNGGTCIELFNDYKCLCQNHTTGVNCETILGDYLHTGAVYHDITQKYYWVITSDMTVNAANEECRKYEGQLADIQDHTTWNFLMTAFGSSDFWTGISGEYFGGSSYTWTTWKGSSDLSWIEQLGPGDVTKTCGMVKSNWKLTPYTCGNHNTLCESYGFDNCVSQPCLNGGTCVDLFNNTECICGYRYSGTFCEIELCSHPDAVYYPKNGLCYWVQDIKDNYDGALTRCKEKNGSLALITDEDLEDFLFSKSLFKTPVCSSELFWIGVTDVNFEGVWTTWDGSRLSYTHWTGYEPAMGIEENCAVVSTKLYWSDKSCSLKYRGLCQTLNDSLYCDDSNCLNGGTCINSKDGYVCNCVQQFYGKNCELGFRRAVSGNSGLSRQLISHNRWSPITGSLWSETIRCLANVVSQDRWSPKTVVSQDRFYCKWDGHIMSDIGLDGASGYMNGETPCYHKNGRLYNKTQICYWLVPEPTTPTQASKFCKEYGGHLARLFPDHQEFIYSEVLNKTDVVDFWINVQDKSLPTIWMTWENQLLNWTNWNESYPVNTYNLDCVTASNNDNITWQNRNCAEKHPYLCEGKLKSSDEEIACNQPGSHLYVPLRRCYWRMEGSLNFYNGEARCRALGGRLANIYNEDNKYFIHEVFFGKDQTCKSTWLGIRDKVINNDRQDDYIYSYGNDITWSDFQSVSSISSYKYYECVRISNVDCEWLYGSCISFKLPILCESDVSTDWKYSPSNSVFYPAKNIYYWYDNTSRNSTDALSECQKYDGILAELLDDAASVFLKAELFMGTATNNRYRIGFKKNDNGELIKPSDDEVISWTKWAFGESPVNDGVVVSGTTMEWESKMSNEEYPFLCQSRNVDNCRSSPCRKGLCINGVHGYTCDCFFGYTGKNCGHYIGDTACLNPDAVYYNESKTCYWMVLSFANQQTADKQCQTYEGHLATIYDDETNTFIADKVLKGGLLNYFWIGVNDTKVEDFYSTWNRNGLHWTSWSSESGNTASIDCVMVNMNYTWDRESCVMSHVYLCESESYENRPCIRPEHTFYYPLRRCYWLASNKTTRDQGAYQCMKDSGHLATIHNGDVNRLVIYDLFNGQCKDSWLGLYNTQENNTSPPNWKTWDHFSASWTNFRPENISEKFVFMDEKCQFASSDNPDKLPTAVCESEAYPELFQPTNATFFPITESYYWFVPAPRNATDANEVCAKHEGQLATIDEQTQEFIKQMEYNDSLEYWIGVYYNSNCTIWVTQNGNEQTWFNWFSVPPSPPTKHCVSAGGSTNWSWTATDCTELHGFLCQWTDIDSCVSDPCQHGGTCVDGLNSYTCKCAQGFSGTHCELYTPDVCNHHDAVYYNASNSCYWFGYQDSLISDATSFCHNDGGILATLYDENTTEFLTQELFKGVVVNRFWIGTNWITPPINITGDHGVYVDNIKYQWNIVPHPSIWTMKLPYLCESTATNRSCLNVLGQYYASLKRCYWKLNNNPQKNYFDAQKYCQEHDGHLANIYDEDTSVWVLKYLGSSQDSWIGTRDVTLDGIFNSTGWRSFEGDELQWTNWLSGQPDNSPPVQECTVMTKTGQWDDRSCSALNSFTTCEANVAHYSGLLPIDAKFDEATLSTYWIVKNKTTAFEANEECQRFDGHLTTIHDSDTLDFITQNLLDGELDFDLWIGPNDLQDENVWKTWQHVNLTFYNWEMGFPNNLTEDAHCTVLNTNGKWENRNCNDSNHFICEYSRPCKPDPCQHSDPCVEVGSTFKCKCHDGYDGVYCEKEIDECLPGPCMFGGTCIDRVASYECVCLNGTYGTNCETNIDDCTPNPCQYNGRCNDSVNNYTCECQPGFEGHSCEIDIDECEIHNVTCPPYQVCFDGNNNYTCRCPKGYAGSNCDIALVCYHPEAKLYLETEICYWVDMNIGPHSAAGGLCQAYHGHVAIPNSQEVTNFIRSHVLEQYGNNTYWIGINRELNGNLITSLGNDVLWTDWNPLLNISLLSLNCTVIMNNIDGWLESNCIGNGYTLCQSPTTPQLNCYPPEAVFDPMLSTCFWYSLENKTVDDAIKHCRFYFGRLGTVYGIQTAAFIEHKVFNGSNFEGKYWIGTNDISNDGQWVTSNGSLASWVNWDSGQPTSNGTKNCVSVITTNNKWLNEDCTKEIPFLCEGKASVTEFTPIRNRSSRAIFIRCRRCRPFKNSTLDFIAMIEAMKVNKTNLTITFRKLNSVEDNRPSVIALGSVSVTVIVLVASWFFCMDFHTFVVTICGKNT